MIYKDNDNQKRFSIGDRVRVVKDHGNVTKGMVGVIVHTGCGYDYCVRFHGLTEGHNGSTSFYSYLCPEGAEKEHYFLNDEHLELADDDVIKIGELVTEIRNDDKIVIKRIVEIDTRYYPNTENGDYIVVTFNKGHTFGCYSKDFKNSYRKTTAEDFYNTKIKVDSPEKSVLVQELLFSYDFSWNYSKKTVVKNSESPYLFFRPSKNITFLTKRYGELFKVHQYKEIFFDDLFPDYDKNRNSKDIYTTASYSASGYNSLEDIYDAELRIKDLSQTIVFNKHSTYTIHFDGDTFKVYEGVPDKPIGFPEVRGLTISDVNNAKEQVDNYGDGLKIIINAFGITPGEYEEVMEEHFKKYNKGENKMDFIVEKKVDFEELKSYNNDNLVAGREKVEQERASFQAEQAAKAYKKLIDQKDELERAIKERQEELEEVVDKLKLFDDKKKSVKK